MIRSFVGAFLWLIALWWLGAWLQAYVGIPEQLGLIAGLIVAGLFVGYGIRLGVRGSAAAAASGLSETVSAN